MDDFEIHTQREHMVKELVTTQAITFGNQDGSTLLGDFVHHKLHGHRVDVESQCASAWVYRTPMPKHSAEAVVAVLHRFGMGSVWIRA